MRTSTTLFELTEDPYFPLASKTRPLTELFQEPTINPQIWSVNDSGSHLSLTASGLTCSGGNGIDGDTTLSTVNQPEMGGALVLEAGGIQFGSITQGVINGLYDGAINAANCFAGFKINQTSGTAGIAPLVNGVVSGSTFTTAAGHLYTLRLRVYCNEMQNVLQPYNSIDDTSTHTYGGMFLSSGGNVVLEVQDTTGGVASAPMILYSGSVTNLPGAMTMAPINSSNLLGSIASFEISQQRPLWVVSTPPGGGAVVRRMGTTAQGADCKIERRASCTSTLQAHRKRGELVAVSYRTAHRAVARLANAASIAQETRNGLLPGTAGWIGSIVSPPARGSMDCENCGFGVAGPLYQPCGSMEGQVHRMEHGSAGRCLARRCTCHRRDFRRSRCKSCCAQS